MLEHRSRLVRFVVAVTVALILCVILAPIFGAMMPSPAAGLVTVAVAILIPKLSIGRR